MAAPLAGFAQARPFAVNQHSHRAQRVCCQSHQQPRQLGAGASGLALLLSASRAWAEGLELPSDLTYPSISVPELPSQLPTDAAGFTQFISDYPLLLPAAAGLVIVPVLISQINGGGSKVQGVSAARVLDLLSSEDAVAFIDIRSKESAKQYGDPDLSSVRKSLIRVPFSKVRLRGPTHQILDCMPPDLTSSCHILHSPMRALKILFRRPSRMRIYW